MKRLATVPFLMLMLAALAPAQPWTPEKAAQWYGKQPWLVGANYTPASAINQLEFWQADTFNAQEIDKELGWAAAIGMNTMRVYLHDLPWQQDAEGFKKRIDIFLTIAQKHGIRPMFVLFDSCWDPFPQLGRQRAPKPGVHNSGWVQGPGAKALMDPKQEARLAAYVKGVVGAFGKDARVLAWDIWNEPSNPNTSSYGKAELKNKAEVVRGWLPKAFAWAWSVKPQQPLTSGLWEGDWSSKEKMDTLSRVMLERSDVISFHNYNDPADLEKKIGWLKQYGRPLLCTEYMARGNKSTFQGSLPVLKKHGIAAYNWGLVAGKTQTNLPWDSWAKPYVGREPAIWFHEVFQGDGKAYRQEEVELIKRLTRR